QEFDDRVSKNSCRKTLGFLAITFRFTPLNHADMAMISHATFVDICASVETTQPRHRRIVPLAGHVGLITRGGEDLRPKLCVLRKWHRAGAYAVRPTVLARKNRRATWTALRHRRNAMAEKHAARCQPIQIRCANHRVARAAECPI